MSADHTPDPTRIPADNNSGIDRYPTPDDHALIARVFTGLIADALKEVEASGCLGPLGVFHEGRDERGCPSFTWSLGPGCPRFPTTGWTVSVPFPEPTYFELLEWLGVSGSFRVTPLPLALTRRHVLAWLGGAESRIAWDLWYQPPGRPAGEGESPGELLAFAHELIRRLDLDLRPDYRRAVADDFATAEICLERIRGLSAWLRRLISEPGAGQAPTPDPCVMVEQPPAPPAVAEPIEQGPTDEPPPAPPAPAKAPPWAKLPLAAMRRALLDLLWGDGACPGTHKDEVKRRLWPRDEVGDSEDALKSLVKEVRKDESLKGLVRVDRSRPNFLRLVLPARGGEGQPRRG